MQAQDYFDVIETICEMLQIWNGAGAFTPAIEKIGLPTTFEEDFKKWYGYFDKIYDRIVADDLLEEVYELCSECPDPCEWFTDYCDEKGE